MTKIPDARPVVRRAAFIVDSERCRRWRELLAYVAERHWCIDPDMYRIDLEQLAELARRFQEDAANTGGGVQLSLTYRELCALAICRDAADTYSHRLHQPPINGVTDAQLAEMDDWIAELQRWFVVPPDPA